LSSGGISSASSTTAYVGNIKLILRDCRQHRITCQAQNANKVWTLKIDPRTQQHDCIAGEIPPFILDEANAVQWLNDAMAYCPLLLYRLKNIYHYFSPNNAVFPGVQQYIIQDRRVPSKAKLGIFLIYEISLLYSAKVRLCVNVVENS
jgi:hypothetical protein